MKLIVSEGDYVEEPAVGGDPFDDGYPSGIGQELIPHEPPSDEHLFGIELELDSGDEVEEESDLGDPPVIEPPVISSLESDGASVAVTLAELDNDKDVVGENIYPVVPLRSGGEFPDLEANSGDEEVWAGKVRVRGETGDNLEFENDRVKRRKVLIEENEDFGWAEDNGS